jgi:hypothetical protein
MVLCWSYAKMRPAGGWIVISKPAGQLRKIPRYLHLGQTLKSDVIAQESEDQGPRC